MVSNLFSIPSFPVNARPDDGFRGEESGGQGLGIKRFRKNMQRLSVHRFGLLGLVLYHPYYKDPKKGNFQMYLPERFLNMMVLTSAKVGPEQTVNEPR